MHTLRRNVFLVDGLGAVASTLSPLLVVPMLEAWIGLPLSVTWVLAIPAALYAVYSLTAWWRAAHPHPWLLPIMAGNLGFCVFLGFYLSHHAHLLTPFGWVWFAGEVAIVVGVVAFEASVWREARQVPEPMGSPSCVERVERMESTTTSPR
jgi:hypothetical protein